MSNLMIFELISKYVSSEPYAAMGIVMMAIMSVAYLARCLVRGVVDIVTAPFEMVKVVLRGYSTKASAGCCPTKCCSKTPEVK